MAISLTKTLMDNYSNYYNTDPHLSEWRRLGAIDKCANILSLCTTLDHDTVVEIGCGDGAILEQLASRGFGSQLTGLEISPSAVECVKRKRLPGLEVRLIDGYELPFGSRQFDLAILSHVLEHVEYPRKLIYEAS